MRQEQEREYSSWGDGEGKETEITLFFLNSAAGAVVPGFYRELSMMTRG